MVRFLLDTEHFSSDLTAFFRRIYGSVPDGDGYLIRRGYVGELEPGLNIMLSIEPDDSVIIKTDGT